MFPTLKIKVAGLNPKEEYDIRLIYKPKTQNDSSWFQFGAEEHWQQEIQICLSQVNHWHISIFIWALVSFIEDSFPLKKEEEVFLKTSNLQNSSSLWLIFTDLGWHKEPWLQSIVLKGKPLLHLKCLNSSLRKERCLVVHLESTKSVCAWHCPGT